ncbi:hypothetical protein MESS2_1600012 [Mesorhizobium metallidurans STM 2683]|uniref:Uncharacterized protein n=1 Tax=Mesorhizobium metallidurans STM 2683 TaxID=1297569 RepID=M5EN58_9HYPH|nr:hypothetical protein MESS2_1600012 [Mesorhizobium metallidurans STM 2683]
MREMVEVISAATELTGDVDKAVYWYRNEPIADCGHRMAAEFVADGSGRSSPGLHPGSWGARVKVTRVGLDEIFHRYLTPKWASCHQWCGSGDRRRSFQPARHQSALSVPFDPDSAGGIQAARQHRPRGNACRLPPAFQADVRTCVVSCSRAGK